MLNTIPNRGPEKNAAVRDRLSASAQPDEDLEGSPPFGALAQEVELLRAEKAALRQTLDELENLLEQKMQAAQTTYAEQQKQEALLEEKSEEIRELHLKLLEDPAAEGARESGTSPREDDLLALSQELEHERRQLREDEATLTDQMREMEVQMSRERAELARQRHELQRLHSEVVHELDRASRHAALRERLQPLQRRHQEMLQREGSRLPREVPAAVAPQPIARPTVVPPPAMPFAMAPQPVARPLAVPPMAASLPAVPPAAEPPPVTPPIAAPAVAPLSELPAPAQPPPRDDEDDLLRRLFG